MAYRTLDLEIMSAQGLMNVHTLAQIRKLKPYAVVSIHDSSNEVHYPEVTTRVDSNRKTNPQWNFGVTFNINITKVNHLQLVVNLKSHRTIRDRDLGVVHVPITELEGFGDENAGVERQKSKDVMNLDGTPQQGEVKLHFSYKFGNIVQQHLPASAVSVRNPATPNVQQRPSTTRHVMGEVRTAMVGMAATAGLSAIFSGLNPFGDDPPADGVPYQYGVDPSADGVPYQYGVDPSDEPPADGVPYQYGVDPSDAGSSAVDPNWDWSAAGSSAVDPNWDSSAAEPNWDWSAAGSSAAGPN